MRIDAFDFEVPRELIAQRPAESREHARLMLLGTGKAPEHHSVADLTELLPANALVVVNDTRVVPARLVGHKIATGGRAEFLLVRRMPDREIDLRANDKRTAQVWSAIGKPSKSLKIGTDVELSPREGAPGTLMARLLGRGPDELFEIALWTRAGETVADALLACGRVPLPAYIKRDDGPDDVSRYQTVYARHDGAVAAPTAGLHLTHDALRRLAARGCEVTSVTLHVGLGTFLPVLVDDLDLHAMHSEHYVVTPEAAQAVARARARGAPVVAIGTTTARALESSADPQRSGHVCPAQRETRLLIQPGYHWRVVDGLLTNFHVPRSTLVALVCAFAGTERVLDAYRVAARERYRFFSYGDAMLLWRSH